MAELLSAAQWQSYRDIMRDMHDTFNKDTLVWRRFTSTTMDRYRESKPNEYTDINLLCLISFNTFRTWPITKHETEGELDDQNMMIWLNKDYLSDNGWLTPDGYLDFQRDKDIFIHRGIEYKCEGDNFASLADGDPIHILLILLRQESNTNRDPKRVS